MHQKAQLYADKRHIELLFASSKVREEGCNLQADIPVGMRVLKITDGAAMLRSGDDFEVKLILIPAPKDAELGLKIEGNNHSSDLFHLLSYAAQRFRCNLL